jgi:hypothetical protein
VTEHGPDCWRDPHHHACAVAAMARAEGQRDEARRSMGEAYQRLAGHEALLIETVAAAAVDQARLTRAEQLLGEYETDLQTKGEDWHPRFRSAVEKVVDQLGQALRADGGGDGDAAAASGQ